MPCASDKVMCVDERIMGWVCHGLDVCTPKMSTAELKSFWREVFKQPDWKKPPAGCENCLLFLVTSCWFLVVDIYRPKPSEYTPLTVIPIITYSFNKYLLRTYCVPHTVVDTRHTEVNKTDQKASAHMEFIF